MAERTSMRLPIFIDIHKYSEMTLGYIVVDFGMYWARTSLPLLTNEFIFVMCECQVVSMKMDPWLYWSLQHITSAMYVRFVLDKLIF
jgi:hypothetical protein